MSLLISLRSELVKTKRTAIWYLSLIAAVAAPLFSFLTGSNPYSIDNLKPDPWNRFLMGLGGLAFNVMILPFFLILMCTLAGQLEYRNNTWKQVYVSPQPLLDVFLAKFLGIQLLLLGVCILNGFLMIVSLLAVDNFSTDLHLLQYQPDWKALFIFYGRIYLTVLSISAFQFWLGLRLKNFIAPIITGLFLWLAGMMMLEEYAWANDVIYPYIYPMRNFFPKTPADKTIILWASAGYTALFLVLGFIDFNRRGSRL